MRLAEQTGASFARKGVKLVYGGAAIGMMGAMADAALSAGGEVIGVIPQNLMIKEVAHENLSRLIITEDMHTRKKAMFDMADAFLTLPGGLGTLDETLEIMSWKYLGLHIKPILILNHEGFYDSLLEQFRRCTADNVMRHGLDKLWRTCKTLEEAFSALSI